MTAVIAITSGRAGVGRSLFSANLVHHMNHKGYRTALLVAGSQTPVWGVSPNTTWPNIIGGRLPIDSAISKETHGIDLMVTGGHGHALGNLSTLADDRLADPMGILDSYAYLIVDMAAGLSAPSIACCLAASETILVLTPDAPSLSSSFDWLRKLTRHGFSGSINIVLNRIQKPSLAQSVYMRFSDLAHKRLSLHPHLWGSMTLEKLPDPPELMRQPLADQFPQSKLWQDIRVIGDRLLAEQPPENQTTPLKDFWQHFIGYIEKLPVMPWLPFEPQTERQDRSQSVETGEPVPTPQEGPPGVDVDFKQAFNELNAKLTEIHAELHAIRKLLESGPQSTPMTDEASESVDDTQMNFDEFIAREERAKR